MKKFIFLGLVAVAALFTGCSSCHSDKAKQEAKEVVTHDYDGVVVDFSAGTEHIQALHRQAANTLIGQKFEWRNSKILFNDYITAETLDDLHVVDVTDVFYYWHDGPWVQYITSNVKQGTLVPSLIPDVWIEDDDLSNAEIVLSAEDVLQLLSEWNGIIPPAKVLILRIPIGPKKCNPQWVIGDTKQVLWIDAVTGEITDWCPAFPKKE